MGSDEAHYFAQVLLVGSDIPDLSVEILKAAFSVLESAEASKLLFEADYACLDKRASYKLSFVQNAAVHLRFYLLQVVFGPAVDGGFYLIGGSKLDPSIFRVFSGHSALPHVACDTVIVASELLLQALYATPEDHAAKR